jgi:hypothetical protein
MITITIRPDDKHDVPVCSRCGGPLVGLSHVGEFGEYGQVVGPTKTIYEVEWGSFKFRFCADCAEKAGI